MEKSTKRIRLAGLVIAAAAAIGVVVPAQAASAAVTTHYYELTHLSSSGTKLCLTSTGKGAAVVMKTCAKTKAQQWFQLSYGNAVVLTNVASVSKTSKSYVLTSSSQSAGATFTMQPVSGATTQQWKYGHAAKNNGFVNASSGRVMAAGSLAVGGRVVIAKSQDGGYLQAWSDYGAGTYS
ncbi:ricin-type beta-trefoil lectin domain protein [Curtobacterium sp. MCPF17_002]|uniref:RICIN domain-containing protein n=1 Tax=Curtobacterium sp. MCPF17_002 TaxID=2175645 RepID=UPI000DA995C2|nr:ricin-type beta-trefoil lectin domain protein [Curtobacterium sp. MCPF17_002]WIB76266.1 ricin-type beta-trefoil lectin domain protein [Curtobacterium sp. MCPF17_002]